MAERPVWLTAPWRRAPRLLLRQPLVVLALVLASVVLGIAAGSAPMFLSTFGTASIHAAAAQQCPEAAMPSVSRQATGSSDIGRTTATITGRYAAQGLPGAFPVAYGAVTAPQVLDGSPAAAVLFYRPGALDHVEKLSSAGGHGVWLPDTVADPLGIRAGQQMDLGTTSALVSGIYRSLSRPLDASYQLPRYWCTWHDLISAPVGEQSPPSLFLTDDPTLLADAAVRTEQFWYSPIDVPRMTLAAASKADTAGDRATADLDGYVTGTDLAALTGRARHVQDGLTASVVPIAGGGVVVALLLVAGAGVFWSLRRAREVRLLVSRGASPGALGLKAALETAPWLVVGSVIGLVLTVVLIEAVGPSSMIEAGAPAQAALTIAAGLVAGVVLIALVGAAAGREEGRRRRSRGVLRHVPWELALIVAAVLAYRTVANHSGLVVDDRATVQLRPALLAFPLLGLGGVLLLVTRLLGSTMPLLRRLARRTGPATFLALGRVTGSPIVTLGLLLGTALPCGVLVYSAGLEQSLRTSVETKYETNLGAPHVLSTVSPAADVPDLGGSGTFVSVVEQDPTDPAGDPVRILGIDPASFARVAFVHGSQRRELPRLTYTGGASIPALLVNSPTRFDSVTVLGDTLHLDVIATPAVFPGLRDSFQPMVVVDRAALADLPRFAHRTEQAWTTQAGLAGTAAILARAKVPVLYELSPDVVVGTTGLLPVTWILDYLRALALLVGLVAIAGLVFALASRTRRRTVAYILARRMGLRRSAHLRSLLGELGVVVGLGWVLGSVVGIGGVAVVHRLLDVYPSLKPPPALVLSSGVLIGLAVAVVLLVVLAAVVTQLAADRARPADVLRSS